MSGSSSRHSIYVRTRPNLRAKYMTPDQCDVFVPGGCHVAAQCGSHCNAALPRLRFPAAIIHLALCFLVLIPVLVLIGRASLPPSNRCTFVQPMHMLRPCVGDLQAWSAHRWMQSDKRCATLSPESHSSAVHSLKTLEPHERGH